MGLFHSHQKEGKGVEKNAMRPIRPLYFVEIFCRKFSKLIQMNLLYIGLTLPIWIALTLFLYSESMTSHFSLAFVGECFYILSFIFLLFSPVIGPATAGMTYVLKSFGTETPVFQFSDFFEQFKKNFKQATLLTLINGLFLLSFSLTLVYGDTSLALNSSSSLSAFQIPLLIVMILLIFINYYAFSIMVMFQMKLKDILVNSFIFALAKLPLNIFILVLVCAISYFAFHYIFTGLILTVLILYTLCGFIVTFSVYPTIEKHMLIPAQAEGKTTNQIDEI